MDVKSCGCLSLFFFLFSIHSYATAEIVLNPERQYQFAEQYFQRAEYYRAIGEYERFIYFFPLSDKVELARYMIGLSYLRGERYKEAIQAFNALIEEYRNTGYALKSYLGISKAYVELKRYDVALSILNNLITIAPDQEIRDKAYYKKGWVYLEMGLWEKARESFEEISPQNRERYNIKQILTELKEKRPLTRKNPTVAGLLAIIPGAGHLYSERKRDALISFLLNGAMIYAAYEAFDHDLDALGGIITLFELGFYSGNIYGAVSSAHKYNRDEKNRFLNYLKEHSKINISLVSPKKNKSILLACQFSF
ncbi:MAG: tetratricopeptide repeat protein [Deltaproteobacteria bacterium]|nr:MAG: tetratricopeptide repeat protein [Deltaproteobacteria bacterium]